MLSNVRFWRGLAIVLGLLVAVLAALVFQAMLSPTSPVAVATTQGDPPGPTQRATRIPAPMPTPGPRPTAGGTQRATPEALGGTLAFSLRRNGRTHIYALPVTGGGLTRLTGGAWDDRDPAWSPDGRRLAFASHRDGNWELYVLDLTAGEVRRITRNDAFDARPAWSPDGNWLAFESNRAGSLDIFVTSPDGEQLYQVTGNAFADYSPSWSPDGRRIAYIAWRSGNPDVWMTDLSRAGDEQAVNLTQSPHLREESPVWSPDGRSLAYADESSGYPIVYTLPIGDDGRPGAPVAVGQGADPAWSPAGQALAVAYRAEPDGTATLAVIGQGGSRVSPLRLPAPARPRGLHWTATVLPAQPAAWLEAVNAVADPALYSERLAPVATAGPPYALVSVGEGTSMRLSDRVDGAFAAWRVRVLAETGHDYLADLDEAWVALDDARRADDGPESWHAAGRAADLADGADMPLVVTREGFGLETYWRLWLLAAKQDGTQGEPLRAVPWDFAARYRGGRARTEGGAYADGYPAGDAYYVDLTELAADYGWQRLPARDDWRTGWDGIRAWHFQRTDGLAWRDALLEVYTREAVDALAGAP